MRGPEEAGMERAPKERATFGVRRGVLGVPTCWQSVTGVVLTLLMWAALSGAYSASVGSGAVLRPMLQLQEMSTRRHDIMLRQPMALVRGRPGAGTEAYAAFAGDERSKGRHSGGAHDSTGASSRPSSGGGSSRMSGSKRHREDDMESRGDLVTGKADFMLLCFVNPLHSAGCACLPQMLLGISKSDDPRLAAAACQLHHQCHMLCTPLYSRHCLPSSAFLQRCVCPRILATAAVTDAAHWHAAV